MNLRLRICSVLAVFVAVNALFVLVVLWAYGVFLPWLVAGSIVFLQHGTVAVDVFRLPVSWLTAAVLVAAFLGAQVYYGYNRVLSRASSGDADHEVGRIVRRLSMTADVPEPNVRVVDGEEPSCYTIGRFTDATIVVSTGLIERLDSDELEAVLAHELAHVANRDVTLMTITTLFVEIADRVYHAARLARRALFDPDELTIRGKLALQWFLPLVALTYFFVAPLLWVFPTIADWSTRTLSHAREFAADAAAARTTGNPLALATALTTLAETTDTPATDLRIARTRALCIVPTNPVTGADADTNSIPATAESAAVDTRRDQVRTWLEGETPTIGAGTDTHPPVEKRVRRLQEIAVDLERTRGSK
ncbi:M48 family metalloprotease [Natronobacterium texcoconense]|uniref:Zn-dependent protease with chaperone function n=1 Tax=Natronobacterium texcoconense TaxID=1095778 RepID=A0A1H0ZI66_NATTX|nr:M48 family metalloprotease [Natronobacterium texcoconense]SDQ26831.1 Zn-dependent protease with chaperone function [Natronobacterium texcoconense]